MLAFTEKEASLPTASLTLPDGTKVNIEGTADEVANLLAKFSQPVSPPPPSTSSEEPVRKPRRGRTSGAKVRKSGPVGNVLRLRDEGFFKTRRSLPEVVTRERPLAPLIATAVHNNRQRLRERVLATRKAERDQAIARDQAAHHRRGRTRF